MRTLETLRGCRVIQWTAVQRAWRIVLSRFELDQFKRPRLNEGYININVLCDVLLNERCIMCYYYISSFLFITKVVTQRIEKGLNPLMWPGEL